MESLSADPTDVPSLKSKVDMPKTSLLTNDPEKLKKLALAEWVFWQPALCYIIEITAEWKYIHEVHCINRWVNTHSHTYPFHSGAKLYPQSTIFQSKGISVLSIYKIPNIIIMCYLFCGSFHCFYYCEGLKWIIWTNEINLWMIP